MSGDRDLRLMRRLAGGDDTAMAGLVAHWQRPLLGFICRFLGCSDDEAHDLAQEVFLRVWRQRRRWRPEARFSTWLFTIAGNLCRNRRRDQGRRPVLVPVPGDEVEPLPDFESLAADDPHARAEAGELSARVRAAVAALPESQRAALLLRSFGSLSYREIGEVLGVSAAAVDSLLVRARRRLAAEVLPPAQDSGRGGVQRRCEGDDGL